MRRWGGAMDCGGPGEAAAKQAVRWTSRLREEVCRFPFGPQASSHGGRWGRWGRWGGRGRIVASGTKGGEALSHPPVGIRPCAPRTMASRRE